MMGEPDDLWLLTTDDGYGFVTRLEDLQARIKNGKAVVNVNQGAKTLKSQRVANVKADFVAAATTEVKLLLFPASELPQLGRGKGVQTIKISDSHNNAVVGSAIVDVL